MIKSYELTSDQLDTELVLLSAPFPEQKPEFGGGKEESTRLKILLAEDHEIICCGLNVLLSKQDDFKIIGEATSCEQVLELSFKYKPHVILLDLKLSDKNSMKYIPKLRHDYPYSEILIVNAPHDNKTHIRALELGAIGVLYKEQTIELICKAIRHVCLNHKLWVDNTLTTEMWKQHRNQSNTLENKIYSPLPDTKKTLFLLHTTLTPKEKEVACLSSKGLSAKQIGEKLFICEKTVRNKLTIIYSKLNVKGQLDLSLNKHLIR